MRQVKNKNVKKIKKKIYERQRENSKGIEMFLLTVEVDKEKSRKTLRKRNETGRGMTKESRTGHDRKSKERKFLKS